VEEFAPAARRGPGGRGPRLRGLGLTRSAGLRTASRHGAHGTELSTRFMPGSRTAFQARDSSTRFMARGHARWMAALRTGGRGTVTERAGHGSISWSVPPPAGADHPARVHRAGGRERGDHLAKRRPRGAPGTALSATRTLFPNGLARSGSVAPSPLTNLGHAHPAAACGAERIRADTLPRPSRCPHTPCSSSGGAAAVKEPGRAVRAPGIMNGRADGYWRSA